MVGGTCATCASEFSARAGAVYCSSACRQKAHRFRVARNMIAMQEWMGQRGAPADALPDVAALMERARRAMDHSDRLRQIAAGHVARAVNLQGQLGDPGLQGIPTDGR